MKTLTLTFLAVAFFVVSYSCRSQQPLMRTLDDITKIKANASSYNGKPLSALLRDIGVPIVFVSTKEGPGVEEYPRYFYFRFYVPTSADSLRALGKQPCGIVAYVKEKFEWDYKSRPENRKYDWTPDDAKRYGSLTVTGIRVMGADQRK